MDINSSNDIEKMITPFTEYIINDTDEINDLIDDSEKGQYIEDSKEAYFYKFPTKQKQKYDFFIMKIYKQKYFKTEKKDLFEIRFKRFLREVSIMARIKHVGTVDLVRWSLSKFYNEDGIFDPEENEYQPFILMPYYERIADSFKGKAMRTNSLQSALFFYGCLRTYSYIHSLDYVLRKINEKSILCEKREDYYYPKISNFATSKKSHNKEISITSQNDEHPILNYFGEKYTKKRDVFAFGLFIYTHTTNNKKQPILRFEQIKCKEDNPFKPLIDKMITSPENRIDFHTACVFFEKQIVPKILTEEKDLNIFKQYVEEINFDEGGNHGYTKIDNIFDKNKFTDSSDEDKFQEVRRILKRANQGDSKAAFIASLYYYSGNILPKDLTLCFLYLKISWRGSFNTIVDSFKRSLISIMFRKQNNNQEGEEQFDEEALFYQGAFYESPKVADVEASSFLSNDSEFDPLKTSKIDKPNTKLFDLNKCEDSNKSYQCYLKSLKIKKTPAVLGRIGALLTKNNKKDQGIRFLELASEQNDLYGMVNYGWQLIKMNKLDEAEMIFGKLYDQEYIDAAKTLGSINFSKGDLQKALDYYTKAKKIYGDDSVKEYIKSIENELKKSKK